MEPLIVFDGGYDPDDRKLPTILQRMSDRRDNVLLVCRTDHGTVPPILAVETFRQVLVEFGIKHVTCDFEADDDIGVLANDLDCPVMSNDSDFFVYDLKAGFIPLDYINLTLCVHNTDTDVDYTCTKDKELNKNEYMYIPVKFYHRDTFVKLVGNKEAFVIPLLATLLGNDYLYASNLQGFYSTLTMPTTRLRYNYSPKTQCRLAALIEWLSDKSDLDSCVELVVAQLKADRRNMIRREIYNSVKSYINTNKHASTHLKSFLDARYTNDENTPTEACNQSVCDYFGNKLPNWVLQRLRMHEVHPMLQNIAVLHRVFLLCQVEILKEISTYRCSEFLRHVTYGIIFQPDLSADTKDNRRNCVQEYDREGKNTKKFYVRPAESIPCYGKLPSLGDVPKMSVEDRQYLLLCSLGVSLEGRSLPCKGRSECRSESLHDSCKDSDLHSELESCKESGAQSGLVSCNESGVQTDQKSCKESGVQSELESCKESGVLSDLKSCKESGVQPDLKSCKESGVKSDLESCKESGVKSDLESCKESGVQSDLESCKESGIQSDLESCKESGVQSDLESCKESGVQSDLISCNDSDVQSDLKLCKESGVKSDLESCKESGVQSDLESCKESGIQSDLESCKESGVQSDLESCKESGVQSDLISCNDSDVQSDLKLCKDSGVQSDLKLCKDSGVQSDLKLCKDSGVQSDLKLCKDSGVQSDLKLCKDSGLQSDHSSKDLDLDSDLFLLVGTTSFWINNANPQVTAAHLDSLIVSLIVIHVKVLKWIDQRKLLGFDFQKPRLYCHITEAFHKSSDKQIQKLEKNLEKYFVKPNHSHKNPRDNAVVHGFAQLQACMQDVIRLNQLLLCPFAPINPSFIINSTFMYNLCREIDVRLEPDLFIVDVLGKKSPLCLLFLKLKERVLSLCKDECFHEKSCQKKKKKNPTKKEKTKVKKDNLPKETKATEKTDEETAANTATEKKDKKARLKTKINCSVTNRFAMLDISD